MENTEINNIAKILGLQYRLKYEKPESLKKLRYGKLMIMADQDEDGSHIKGLVINFIHSNWPNLLKHNFVEVFITPIVKVSCVMGVGEANGPPPVGGLAPQFPVWARTNEDKR